MSDTPKMCPLVTLLGVTRNTDNYGVRVLLSAAVEALAIANPGAEVAILDYGHKSQNWIEETRAGSREIRLINLRFSWRLFLPNNIFRLLFLVIFSRLMPGRVRHWLWQRNRWLREIQRARAHYSIAGGDSFSDIYGLRRFLYVALPQVLVLLMGRPLVLLPQTYGPFKGRLSRMLARYILRRSSRVFSRDEAGVDATKAIIGGNGRVIHVMPDLGFCMMPEPLDDSIKHRIVEMRSEGNVVGLNVSSLLYMGGYTGNNMFQLRESFPLLIDAVVDHLVGTLDAQILLVPHVCGGTLSQEDETRLCRRLEEKFRQKHGKRVCCLHCELNHRQMKSLIGECDLFIGARMHACIGAVSQCVPTICLAYSKKFAGVMKPLGAGARVVDLRQAAIADVIEVITKVFRERKKLRQELQPAATELLGRLNLQFASNFFLGVLTASEGTVDSCATGLENPALVRRS